MKLLLLLIIPVIFVYTASAQVFSTNPLSKNIDITFNSPKGDRGWSDPYIIDFDISVTNELNATSAVSISPSSNNPSYISLSSSKSHLNIPALSSESVRITVKIADSAADGGSYSGRVRFSSGSQTDYVNVNVRTFWPPPTLILSGDLDFDELKAGSTYSRSFTLKEILKFKNANDVRVGLIEDGPINSVTVSPPAFSNIDTKGRTITFSFKVKERNIIPGTYSPTISISSSNNAQLVSSLRYSIPRPVVEVSQPPDEIIFEYGKQETGNQKIKVSETGGKTPLENTVISFEKLSKELLGEKKTQNGANWFNFLNQLDYIAPAGSTTVDFKVTPKDASVGRYTWEGTIKTKYAGEKPFQFYFVVIPPHMNKIRDNLTELKNDPLVINYPGAENLRKTTESLLNKELKRMVDIENVISMTNVVIRLLNSISSAYSYHERNSYIEAYEEFRTSNEEIAELNSITLKQVYSKESSDITNSADNVWKGIAFLIINGLEQNADRLKNTSSPNASYAEARKTHEKIRDICSWLKDTSCMLNQENEIIKMNNKIEELILEAGYLKNEVEEIHEGINRNTWTFFNVKLLKNPFKFLHFLDEYNKMTRNYNKISKNYRLAGEQNEFEKAEENLYFLEKEYERFRLVNGTYVIILLSILILTTWNSIKGFFKYRADLRDVGLAKVVQLRRIS